MAKVTVRNLSKSFHPPSGPAVAAVRALSLEIPDREFTVLTGPCGAGKTTILRLLAGLETLDAGEILVGDRAVHALPASRRELGFASGSGRLLPHLTLGGNLSLALRQQKTARDTIERRITEVSAQLGLGDLLARRADALNPADFRRGLLAMALVLQPRAFVLDDPLRGLDAPARSHLRADIARIFQHLRATVLYATDDPADAMTLATHLVVLRHGAIEQAGAPMDVYRQPQNSFVASFLGQPGMNLIRGVLKSTDRGLVFKESGSGVIELKLGERPEAQGHAGADVLLGVRPENCVPVPMDHPNGPGIFQTLVDFVECRGGETLFHLQTGAHNLVSRAAVATDIRESGRRLRFRIDPTHTLLFDPSSTLRLA